MKKLVFTSFLIIFSFCLTAQPLLYALTSQGGANDGGTLVSFDATNNKLAAVYNFDSTNGARPTGSLFQASDGIFYGMTSLGGANNRGVIFSFNPVTSAYKKLFDFSDSIRSGYDFIQVSNNILISASFGGVSTYGEIFSFDISNSTCSIIYRFSGTDGAYPDGSLFKASNGILYGVTSGGGSRNVGVIFSYTYPQGVYTKLYDFTGSVFLPIDNFDGARPDGSLVEASNGKLYGVTSQGGQVSSGTVFSFNPADNSYSSIYSFPIGTWNPQGFLTRASNGKIYFLTENSFSTMTAGRVWSIEPYTNSVNTAGQFGGPNGYRPFRNGLIELANGKLYGMTARGSNPFPFPGGNGVVFSLDTTTSIITWHANFSPAFGILPSGSFIMNSVAQGPLPLTITGFTVMINGKENVLQWFTMNEQSVSHIEIERSRDGIHFTSIGRVYSKNNNNAKGTYSFNDTNPLTSVNYYRLKIIDHDQSGQYSQIKVVKNTAEYSVKLYPNAASDNVILQVTSNKILSLKAEIFSSDGKVLQTTKLTAEEGTHIKKINTIFLSKGNYLLKLTSLTNEHCLLRFQKF